MSGLSKQAIYIGFKIKQPDEEGSDAERDGPFPTRPAAVRKRIDKAEEQGRGE